MAAVLPRKFIPHQLRFNMDQAGQLTAQLIQLQNPWDRHARVLEVATTPPKVPLPQTPQHHHHQQQQQEHQHASSGSPEQQQPQQQQQPHSHSPRRARTHVARHFDPWSPLPPGLMHPLSRKQLQSNRFLAPPFVLQSDLAQCQAAGHKIAAKIAQIVRHSTHGDSPAQGKEGSSQGRPRRLVVGAELPDPVAHHPQLLALLRALEEGGGGAVQVVRSIVKAKVLQHR